MGRATSAGTGPAEGMAVTLTAACASELTLAAPLEGGGVGVPAARGRFEPVDDVVWGRRGLAGEGAADEDALDRLGHVQPGAAEWGVERHDAVFNQPQHERGGLVAAEIVPDQEHPQGRQAIGQRELDREPVLPVLPGGPAPRFGLGWWLWRRRRECRQFGRQPGVQHRVGGAGDTLDPNPPGRRVEQGQQLGRAVTDVLVRVAGRAGRRAPVGPGLGDRLVRPGLILGPDRQLGLGVRPLDQPLFTVASG